MVIPSLIKTFIYGFSNVFFQENIILGILIIVGMAIASPTMILLASIGNIVATGTIAAINLVPQLSPLLGKTKYVIDTGLLGFNGVLIGSAVSFYLKDVPTAILLTIVASILSAIIFTFLFRNGIPPFAAPFAIMGWLIVLAIKYFKLG